MAGRNGKLTPTQERILARLSDGSYHSTADLQTCLEDDLAGPSAVYKNITLLRKVLRPKGQDIVSQGLPEGPRYRWVRIVSISE